MSEKILGKVSQFGAKGYGFINGSDGKQYFVHQKNIKSNIRLKIGTNVKFIATETEKGLVAATVTLADKESTNKNNTTNILLSLSFTLHLITIYAVFFK